tara:strand:+ start:660 stop:761 length:102 start_codon:yes stop_codon:yes gene_type:complete
MKKEILKYWNSRNIKIKIASVAIIVIIIISVIL